MDGLRLQSEIKREAEPEDWDSMPQGRALGCMLHAEVGAVLAAKRRRERWGGLYMASDDTLDPSHIQSLKALQREIFSWKHQWHTIDPAIYLKPFLNVIGSAETGAPITEVALTSVYKILSLGVLDLNTINVKGAMHLVVDAVTSCQFKVTDCSSEEAVLMKILQVLLPCIKSKAFTMLDDWYAHKIVNTCFRVVHPAGTKSELLRVVLPVGYKSELLRRIAQHTMHELVRCTFLHLPESDYTEHPSINEGRPSVNPEQSVVILEYLLDIVNHVGMGPRSEPIAFDQYVMPCVMELINLAIELGGSSISKHPKLLDQIRDRLLRNLMEFDLSLDPLVLSRVCSIVLNLYHHLRMELKLHLEAFFSIVILRLEKNMNGISCQQQEIVMEALVNFCRHKTFMAEIYANLDCDITCSNMFEDLLNFFSKSAIPGCCCPLSSMNLLALDGMRAILQVIFERIDHVSPPVSEQPPVDLKECTAFWTVKCENYADPNHWVGYVRRRKVMKRRLMIGANNFNRNNGNDWQKSLQDMHLLPDIPDPQAVAYFLRYAARLDKKLVGNFVANHDEFSVQVLNKFVETFDFANTELDNALRLFFESLQLPDEVQKIPRILKAFSKRYYEQLPSLRIVADVDVVMKLSYSLVNLSNNQHNIRVKKKMTVEDFIEGNKRINDGVDLPQEFLSYLYYSICKNGIQTTLVQGAGSPDMTLNWWIDLTHKSKKTSPYIMCDSKPFLDHDMFDIMCDSTLRCMLKVFGVAKQVDVFKKCIEGFLVMANISVHHHRIDVLDKMVVALCEFTTLLNPSSDERFVIAFGNSQRAQMATETVFDFVNKFGDYICEGWENVLNCTFRLHKLEPFLHLVIDDAVDFTKLFTDPAHEMPAADTPRRSFGLMNMLRQFSFEGWFNRSLPPEMMDIHWSLIKKQEIRSSVSVTFNTINNCRIHKTFIRRKYLRKDSVVKLQKTMLSTLDKYKKWDGSLHEDAQVFFLQLLIKLTIENVDYIIWEDVYGHIRGIIVGKDMPRALVEEAIFGLLLICQQLLSYKEDLADVLLSSLRLIIDIDTGVTDAYCERIAQGVVSLLRENVSHIRSYTGWKIITSLLTMKIHDPATTKVSFEGLMIIMSKGAHLSQQNYALCLDALILFAQSQAGAQSQVGLSDIAMRALDLMAESVVCLSRWCREAKESCKDASKMYEEIEELWFSLVERLKKMCFNSREDVRNHALTLLKRCLTSTKGICFSENWWLSCFKEVVFRVLDVLLDTPSESTQYMWKMEESSLVMRNIEDTLVLAMKLLTEVFLQVLEEYSQLCTWELRLDVVSRMYKYTMAEVKGKRSEKLKELLEQQTREVLLAMKLKGVLSWRNEVDEQMWVHVNNIAPGLESEVFHECQVFLDQEPEQGNTQSETEKISQR